MNSNKSYIYDPTSKIEKERLREREKRTSTRRSFVLDNLNFNDVKDILDVGCGDGAVGFDLLTRSENARLVGVDIEPSMLEEANKKSPVKKVCEFVAGDGKIIPFASSSFDLVTCQYVLQHVPNPTRILEEMRRVSRRDARSIIFEWDDGVNFSHPSMPVELDKLFKAKIQLIRNQGGDRFIGRKLYHLLQAAGWRDIDIKIIHDTWQGPGDRTKALRGTELRLKEIRPQLLSHKFITEDEFELGMKQLYEYYCSDIFSVVLFFAGIGVNPG